ncbi:MAG: hypothetical protein J6S79_01750 [Lachnospiraceae bacterium]|jgi:hypothetical protein|nr:hypothetical protein [Lachnospiraceae bacterium]
MAKQITLKNKTIVLSGRPVKVARKNASEASLLMYQVITDDEAETDKRAKSATRAAIKKAIVCKTPVARFDVEKKKAFLEYADGSRTYVD